MSALPSRFKGILFRSRTEARWAVFLDALGLSWEYEPEGYHLGVVNYLPDFVIEDRSLYIEVKGTTPNPDEIEKCRLLAEATGKRVLLVRGNPGQMHGWLFTPGIAQEESCLPTAFLARCRRCEKTVVTYQYGADGNDGHGCFPLADPCGDLDRCSDRFTPFGNDLDAAIAAARAYRFEPKKRTA
jgi:hypothetical protein